jgi:ABC-type uncharacterized transport system substrate-binding protein
MRIPVCLIVLVAAILTSASLPAQQTSKMPRIGFTAPDSDYNLQVFRERLKDLGYVEGKNIKIEYRYPQGKGASVEAELARELVRLNVDVIIATAYPAILAAKEATKKIPIVMIASVDPVATGLVSSLARPGGNVTGVSTLAGELSGKRLELLLDIVPNLSRVAVLVLQDSVRGNDNFKTYQEAAGALKIDLRRVDIRGATPDLSTAFDSAIKARSQAMIPIRNGTVNRLTQRIAKLALESRLPTMFERYGAVQDGGLVSYTTDEPDSYRRAAVYVDKILKGTKPADLPVERSKKFELAINLKTAKQIGLTIPPNVLARADKVIR